MSKFQRHEASFRNRGFRQALNSPDGRALFSVVESQQFSDFRKLLGALRNSIHAIGLRGIGVGESGKPQASLARVFEDEKTILDSVGSLGSPSDLAVSHAAGLAIEPYTCAMYLAEVGIRQVNAIAAATMIERLLPPGVSGSQLPIGPPKDGHYSDEVLRRVAALG